MTRTKQTTRKSVGNRSPAHRSASKEVWIRHFGEDYDDFDSRPIKRQLIPAGILNDDDVDDDPDNSDNSDNDTREDTKDIADSIQRRMLQALAPLDGTDSSFTVKERSEIKWASAELYPFLKEVFALSKRNDYDAREQAFELAWTLVKYTFCTSTSHSDMRDYHPSEEHDGE